MDISVFLVKVYFFLEVGFNLKFCILKIKIESNFEKFMWREGEILIFFFLKRFVVCKMKRLVVRKGRVLKEINYFYDYLEGEYV